MDFPPNACQFSCMLVNHDTFKLLFIFTIQHYFHIDNIIKTYIMNLSKAYITRSISRQTKNKRHQYLLGKPTRGENPKESFLYNARSKYNPFQGRINPFQGRIQVTLVDQTNQGYPQVESFNAFTSIPNNAHRVYTNVFHIIKVKSLANT